MSGTVDINRINLLLKFILVAAGQQDYEHRELGLIHLIKYVYLADLAYATKHEGQIYTGVPWQFHHFGPWSQDVWRQALYVIEETGARKRTVASRKYEDDLVRWSLIDDRLFEELEKKLPFDVSLAIQRAIKNYGDDTSTLLHHVYTTMPMLHAAPGELLDFSLVRKMAEVSVLENQVVLPKAPPISKAAEKRRQKAVKELREKIHNKLVEKRTAGKRRPANPPPRYDEVYFEGLKMLDELAGPAIEPQEGQLSFSPDIWKSPLRTESDVP